MLALTRLVEAVPTDLRPVVPPTVPAATVSGVHVSELLDPTPYLDGGELLLTTGLTLPGHALGVEGYVARLVGHGISALGYGLGPVSDVVPPLLVETCARLRLPLLMVPQEAPFQSVIRAWWALATAERDDTRQVSTSAHAVVRAALGPRPDEAVIKALAASVGGWALLVDRRGDVRCRAPHSAGHVVPEVLGELRRIRLDTPNSAASFPVGEYDALVHTLDAGGRATGHLAVGCPRPLPPHARHLVLSACALVSLRRESARPVPAARTAAPVVVGHLLRLGHEAAAADLATCLGLPVPPRVRLGLVSGAAGRDVEEVCMSAGAFLAPGDPAMVVVPLENADDVWRRLRSLRPAVDGGATSGLLGAATRWRDVPTLLLRLEELQQRTPAGAWSVLGSEGGTPVDIDEGELARLAEHPRAHLVPTLVSYLRHRGRIESAAAELGIHRNSMRHRLELIRSVLDVDIDDPDVASRWWLALRARGLA